MNVKTLSREDQLTLCRAVERLCGARLRDIRGFADPQDKPLLKVLDERVEDGRVQLRALERLDRGDPASIRAEDVERFIREHFPSQRRGIGEGPLTRDVALYLAECVEDERSRFYHELAAAACEPDTRELFRQLAARDEEHLKFLRTVLLYNLSD
ncbi:MAG TPA: hypothetical protein VEJ18_11985 [Planctomycetota bacterium]|nr:hypothetical protein [Planctomycetota bacterium]